MSERMQSYHALVRALVCEPVPRGKLRGPQIYAGLVARQHWQPLAQMFEAVRTRVGDAAFDALVHSARRQTPPRHPNPARWARAFADMIGADQSLDEGTRALAEYVALRVECAIAPDAPWEPATLRPGAVLSAFPVDPRALVREPKSKMTSPTVLALYRDDDAQVAMVTLGPEEVAAWGVLSGEADAAMLARAGVDEAALARGRARLVAHGLLSA